MPVRGLRFDRSDENFATALKRLCTEWDSSGRTTLATDLAPVWPPLPVRHELAQILDEALDNVSQHAGATRVRVTLAERRGDLVLTVEDNGRGFALPLDESALHSGDYDGLAAMARRARSIGAVFSLSSEPHSGTTLSVRMAK
nr:ATP-binding protein [Kineosporia babensis]